MALEEQWAALGGTDDPGMERGGLAPTREDDDRFKKAVERFWKRKHIHYETTRKPEELRAIQREAEAQKEKQVVEAAPPPEPAVEDEEAKARREEREKRKAEADARRAAEAAEREARAAEREARKKEDA